MRTYGRIGQIDGVGGTWVEIDTSATGGNDYVWLTTLIQNLKLVLGESPIWGDYGIPAPQAIAQQIPPDYFVALTQQRFSSHFASLLISRVSGAANPTYNVNVLTNAGTKMEVNVPT